MVDSLELNIVDSIQWENVDSLEQKVDIFEKNKDSLEQESEDLSIIGMESLGIEVLFILKEDLVIRKLFIYFSSFGFSNSYSINKR